MRSRRSCSREAAESGRSRGGTSRPDPLAERIERAELQFRDEQALRDALAGADLTEEELAGRQAELLVSGEPPLGSASFRSWVAANGERLGRDCVSELARNFRPYDPL